MDQGLTRVEPVRIGRGAWLGQNVVVYPGVNDWRGSRDRCDQRVVVLATNHVAAHQAGLFRQLTDEVTVVLHDAPALGEQPLEAVTALAERGVEVITEPAVRVVSADGRLSGLELSSGRIVAADAVAVATFVRARADLLAPLGIEPTMHPSGIGTAIAVDESGATSVHGVYAAGNVTNPTLQVLPSAAAGVMAGARINAELVDDDTAGAVPSNEWDLRYADDHVWSGNPNGTLVVEVDGLEPGRALDVGCGEGADAVWLAERGWSVVALDVAASALDRLAVAAESRDVSIETVCADLPSAGLDAGSFDLVSLFYPAIARTPEWEAVEALLDTVAPGGTLLVVGHAVDAHDSGHGHRAVSFDPNAYVQVDDIAARLDPDAWTVTEHGVRDRPAGHNTHHHRDIVLRATRH